VAGIQKVDSTGRFEKVAEHFGDGVPVLRLVFEDKNKTLWAGTEMGLGKFGPKNDYQHIEFPFPELKDLPIFSMEEDKHGNLWVGTMGKGLAIINKERTKVSFYKKNLSDPNSISNDDIAFIYRDNTDIFWLGGFGGGINKYDDAVNKFQNYQDYYSDNLTSLIEDRNGNVWFVNGSKGVSRYHPSTNSFKNFMNKNFWQYSICEDSYGNIWTTNPHVGLSKFSRDKQAFLLEIRFPAGYILISGPDGKIYCSTMGQGLKAINPLTKEIEDIPSGKTFSSFSSFCTGNNKIWIGGNKGMLGEFDFITRKIAGHQLEYKGEKISQRIISVLEDKKGNIWVAPSGRGLYLVDNDTKKCIKVYDESTGMPNNDLVTLLEDHNGNIWASTNNGLCVLDPVTEKIKTYTTRDGLVNNEFNSFVAFKNKNGRLYFGGMEGFNYFYPEQLKENKAIPPVVLTDFQIFNKSVPVGGPKDPTSYFLETGIDQVKSIELSYDQNVFSFEFAALNFSLQEKNKFAYRMEGFDKDWIYTDSKRTATYTNLNPGKYRFKVKASNNDGVWNEKGTSLQVIINPPFWRTWWAYLTYPFIGAFMIYGTWKHFTNKQKLQNELNLKALESQKLQEIDEIKTRFYTNVSHEFRTPLTLILGPLETALSLSAFKGENEIKSNLELVNRNAQRLLALINQLMDFSKLESGNMKLDLEEADLIPFLRTCTLSFSSLAVSKGIELAFVTTAEQLITLFDKDKLEKILNNLLSNALKFTRQGGSVSVFVDSTENELLLQVTDDGIGIPEDQVGEIFNRFYQVNNSSKTFDGTGIGLALLKELVSFHNGTINVKSNAGSGTVFTLRFPIQIKELKKTANSEKLTFREGVILAREKEAEWTESHFLNGDVEEEENKSIILVVEDNPEIRAYVVSAFGKEFIILEAENGEKGLAVAEKNIPDLIITDIMMPVMDGQELCRLLKTNEKTSHIPVILLTAKASQESKLEGFETGADDYITKPFYLKELQVRVKNLIEQREKLRKRFTREVKLQPKEIAITSADENFLNRCISVIEQHMSDPDFSVDAFGKEVGMSRSQLHRKLKALTDQSTSEFIRNIRLKRAAELIKNKFGNTAEVSYEVGFNSVSYFIKCFKEVYGKTPTEIEL
jgi:signal transduction histidine kinase/DNA-binding response OmpR family regulator/streptogramin lyase